MRDRDWERELRAAAARVERELRGGVGYVNDRLVPPMRAEGLRAMREGARLLRRCADLLDGKARP